MATGRKNKFRETPILESTFVEENKDEKIVDENEVTETDFKVKKNSRKTAAKKQEQSAQPSVSKLSIYEKIAKARAIYLSDQAQKITGLLLILIGVYLGLAFVSYFFTRHIDHDKVMSPFSEYFSNEVKVHNWLGKLGALVAHLFIYKGFGIAAFILIPVFVVFGVQKLLQKQIIRISSFNAKWLFLMVWFSLTSAYFFSDRIYFIGGSYGYYINQQISNFIGNAGLLMMLGFSMLTFLVLVINLSFKIPMKVESNDKDAMIEEIEEENDNQINAQNIENDTTALSKEEEERLLKFEIKQSFSLCCWT
jgi:S-DNA-T family DNA segregation ATPase FtsK/SpoIIIE